MRFGAFKYDSLPPRVRRAVDEEVKRQKTDHKHQTYDDETKWRVRLLSAARERTHHGSGGNAMIADAMPGQGQAAAAAAGRRSAADVSDTNQQ